MMKIYLEKINNNVVITKKKTSFFIIIIEEFLRSEEYKEEKRREFLKLMKRVEKEEKREPIRFSYTKRKEKSFSDKINTKPHIWSFTSKYTKGNAKAVRYEVKRNEKLDGELVLKNLMK